MDVAIAHLGDVIENVAPLAPEDLKIGPNFPVDFSPGDPVGLSYEGDKLLEIPRPVNDMLGSNLSVIINIRLSLRAVEHLSLAHREQFIAESALVEVVTLFLKQQLQLFHEKSGYKLVFPFFQDVEAV
jgi:hypothetical protein